MRVNSTPKYTSCTYYVLLSTVPVIDSPQEVGERLPDGHIGEGEERHAVADEAQAGDDGQRDALDDVLQVGLPVVLVGQHLGVEQEAVEAGALVVVVGAVVEVVVVVRPWGHPTGVAVVPGHLLQERGGCGRVGLLSKHLNYVNARAASEQLS